MKATLIAAATLMVAATVAADARQFLIPGPAGPRYSRPFPNLNQPPPSYYRPGPYYQPFPGPYYRPSPGPYYQRSGPPPILAQSGRPVEVLIGAGLIAAAAGAAAAGLIPPPPPLPQPVTVQPPPDALDEVAPVNPQGITREEVNEALTGWCQDPRNAVTPMCQKMGGPRIQR